MRAMLAVIVLVDRGHPGRLPLLCPRKYLGQFWSRRTHGDSFLGGGLLNSRLFSAHHSDSERAVGGLGRVVCRRFFCKLLPLLVKCSQSLNARSRRRSCCCRRLRSRKKWSPIWRPSPTISSVLEVIILIANRDRPLDVKWTRE